MTKNVKSSQISKTAKESAKNGTNKVSSEKINTELLGGVIENPVGAGLSDGTQNNNSGVLSSPSVGGDGANKGKGRSDNNSQIENSAIMEGFDKSAKGVLRSKLSAAFRAPLFPDDLTDWENSRKKLVESGDITKEEFEDMRNKKISRFRSSVVAPVFSYSLLCDYVREHLKKEWALYCPFVPVENLGVGVLSVGVVWSWTGIDKDMPTSSPLLKDSTLSDTITAVLSCAVYGEGMHSYNNRLNTAAKDGFERVREGVRLLLSANVLGKDIISGLSDLVSSVVDEQNRIKAKIENIKSEIAAKEMENALAALLSRSAAIRLRSFCGGLSDYELGLVGLRGWSETRVNNVVSANNASIRQKWAEIKELEKGLN